jgi:Zn-finger nucleic acid-binding protein
MSMSKIWDDKKKSQEEEYFRRKEQEAIEKMRAHREAERQAREAAGKSLQCPKCDGALAEVTLGNVAIDRCNKCNGVWLDAGELELLIDREEREEKGWLSRMWRNVSSS